MEQRVRLTFLDGNNEHTKLYFQSVEEAREWLVGRYDLSLVEIRVLAVEPEEQSFEDAEDIEQA